MAVQALAGEIVAALLADEKDGGYDLTAGMFGSAFSALVRRWAAAELASQRAEPDWAAVRDKRMSELTPAQFLDARELWIRNQLGWLSGQNHIEFLLQRLDAARGVNTKGVER